MARDFSRAKTKKGATMRKSDFNHFRAMLKKEYEILIYNYHPHIIIICPRHYALAYPDDIYRDWIGDDIYLPKHINIRTGISIKSIKHGRKKQFLYKKIPESQFRISLLEAITSVENAALQNAASIVA